MKSLLKTDASSEIVEELRAEVERLSCEKENLERKKYRLRLKKDDLAKAAEIKNQGASLKALTNRENAVVIDALRDVYKLNELLPMFQMAKSSYCYQAAVFRETDKRQDMLACIEKLLENESRLYAIRKAGENALDSLGTAPIINTITTITAEI